jgi:hypothetical protein
VQGRRVDIGDGSPYAGLCLVTKQDGPYTAICTKPKEPWHRVHTAYDAGGGSLANWYNTESNPDEDQPGQHVST